MRLPEPEPYDKDYQVREAARILLLATTPQKERNGILERFRHSPKLVLPLLPLIFGNLHNKSRELQEMAFDLAEYFAAQGYDIGNVAADIASHLNAPSDRIRKTACRLLEKMGQSAKPAEDFALGCLRNKDREIAVAGLRILRAIGPGLSRGITQRIGAVFEIFPHDAEIGDLAREVHHLISQQSGAQHGSILATIDPDLLRGKTCLIIEDNAPYRLTMRSALESFGVRVEEAANGREGLRLIGQKAAEGGYDAVLLDIRLPDINGIKLLDAIRANPQTEGQKVIVISGIGNDEIILAARKYNVAEYIIKSTEMGITLKMIANALGG